MLVSLTIIRYKKRYIPFAFLAMAVHRIPLLLTKKCSFWKLLGSGRNGTFDLMPDFCQWGLLAAWDDRQAFESFLSGSLIVKWWRSFGAEYYTILCKPVSSNGKWDGREPFTNDDGTVLNGPVAVLTRATIRPTRLKNFWKNVDSVAGLMSSSDGYITSFGIGEAPVYLQATFSLWEDLDSVKKFAYRSREHAAVIQKTREENWYSEELFARFKPIATFGTLKGNDPLKGRI